MILFIAVLAIAAASIAATFTVAARDGYRAVPTRTYRLP